jgi:hypothetical protein
MRRAVFFTVLALTALLRVDSLRAENTFGLGLILGDPSGITGKVFLGENSAIDIGLGNPEGKGYYVYSDYLLHLHELGFENRLAFYFGGGAAFHHHEWENRQHRDEEENRIELRIPAGLEFVMPKIPIGVFAELVPALRISPDVEFEFRGGIGARYYF